MKLHISDEWLERIEGGEGYYSGGTIDCSPEIFKAAQEYAGRQWDGSEEDAERLLRQYWQHPFV